jgi:hypothetical protein
MSWKTQANPGPMGFLVSEAEGSRSRENVVIAVSQTILSGTVLGRINLGAISNRTGITRTGNGAVSGLVRSASAKVGGYRVVCVAAASNAGTFAVFDPSDRRLPDATVGAAYSSEIGFTIADGSADFIVGDTFWFDVAAGSGQYGALDLAATSGLQVAQAIAGTPVTTTAEATSVIPAVVRDAEVNAADLKWPAGISNENKALATAKLAEVGLIAR